MQAATASTTPRTRKIASPAMTAARPTTMVPVPRVMSAKPFIWAKSAPPRATMPLESAMPTAVTLRRGDPLGAGHARVGAGGAHAEAVVGDEEPGDAGSATSAITTKPAEDRLQIEPRKTRGPQRASEPSAR